MIGCFGNTKGEIAPLFFTKEEYVILVLTQVINLPNNNIIIDKSMYTIVTHWDKKKECFKEVT